MPLKSIMMEKINITDANVIEQIRGNIPTATSAEKGLLSSTNIIEGGMLLNPAKLSSVNPDDYYLHTGQGLIMAVTASNTPNWNYTNGVVLHCQRFVAGDVTPSQVISQILFSEKTKGKSRIGIGDGEKIVWKEWSDL